MNAQNLVLYDSFLLYQMRDKSIFVTDLNGVESVSMVGIILTLQLCVESLGMRQMVSLYSYTNVPIIILALANYYHHALQVLSHIITPLMKMML
jgi:hypothetical protein